MRQIPTGKMPSVSVIDVKVPPKGAPSKSPLDPNEGQEQETSFTCPACGEKMIVESAKEEEPDEIGGGIGGDKEY